MRFRKVNEILHPPVTLPRPRIHQERCQMRMSALQGGVVFESVSAQGNCRGVKNGVDFGADFGVDFGVDFWRGFWTSKTRQKSKFTLQTGPPQKIHSSFHTGFRACFRASFRRGFRPSFRPEKPKIHDTFLSYGCRELCLVIWPEFACSSDMENARGLDALLW